MTCRHMLGVSCEAAFDVASNMTCHTAVLVEYLHSGLRKPDVELLANKLIGHRVEVLVAYDVVIDADFRRFPLRELVVE